MVRNLLARMGKEANEEVVLGDGNRMKEVEEKEMW